MKKVYWLYYTYPEANRKTYTKLGMTYVCYSDDHSLVYSSSKYGNIAKEVSESSSIRCIDGIRRHQFEVFRSLEELKLVAAIRDWDLRAGKEVFGNNIVNCRQLDK